MVLPLLPFTYIPTYIDNVLSELGHPAPGRMSPSPQGSAQNRLLPSNGCSCPALCAASQHTGSSSWRTIPEQHWESDASVSLNTGSNKERWDLLTVPHPSQPTSSFPHHALAQGFQSGPRYQCVCNRMLLLQGLLSQRVLTLVLSPQEPRCTLSEASLAC